MPPGLHKGPNRIFSGQHDILRSVALDLLVLIQSSESIRFEICDAGEVPLYNFSNAGEILIFVRRKNMKFNARDLKKQSTLHWNIITSMPKSPRPARLITLPESQLMPTISDSLNFHI